MKKADLTIDLKRLRDNYQFYALKGKKIIAIVKDNAYGHGIVECSQELAKDGCDFFAVSSLEEAIKLRENQINCGILLLGYLDTNDYSIASNWDISCVIYSISQLKELMHAICYKQLKVHLKINTGMLRNGILPNEFSEVIELINKNKHLKLEGIFTHYVGGKDCHRFVEHQFIIFKGLISSINHNDLMIHASSTNSISLLNDNLTNYTRIGLGLYGLSAENNNPILSLNAPIVQVYQVKKGDLVGYDNAFSCQENGFIYTLPIGYSDGIKPSFNHKAFKNDYLIQGGKVSMDYSSFFSTMRYQIGDVIELIGDHIDVEMMAKATNTSKYDIVCSLHEKIKRIFINRQ